MEEPNHKQIISMGAAIVSIAVLIGAVFGVWGLFFPVALYFFASTAQR